MKKRLKIFLSLFLVMIFCIIPVQVSAGDVNGIKIEVPYQYPIHPDTEE